MARTTKALIEGVIELDASIVPDDPAMVPFIDLANELVTEYCTGAKGPTVDYTAAHLILIETWLAAHFYTNRDPRAFSEKAGSVSAITQNKVDLGFDTSFYGQSAMRLDTNGGLSQLNSQAKAGSSQASASWLGTDLDP